MKKLFLFIVALNLSLNAFSEEEGQLVDTKDSENLEQDISVMFAINEIKTSNQPIIYSAKYKYAIFTFEHKKREVVHNINVVFEHENFAIAHSMKRNVNGIFFLIYKLDGNMIYNQEELVYSYIIDGIWNKDPKNPYEKKKASGYTFSIFSNYKSMPLIPPNSPIITKSKGKIYSVDFYFKGPPNKVIYLAGDFNNWDPYMYRLEEDVEKPGVYHIDLSFKKGHYLYYFILNGSPVTDPNNQNTMYSKEAYHASILDIE